MEISTLGPYPSDVRALAKVYVTFRIGKSALAAWRHQLSFVIYFLLIFSFNTNLSLSVIR